MTTVSNDLLSSMNGTSTSTSNTSSLNDNSPEAIQNRFLKLLTVQMQNQDPTAPMDNSQLTTQLAQLSTVSGISTLNQTLASLMSNLDTSQSLQAANMIGHSVLAAGNNLTLTSDTVKAADGTETTTQKAVFGVQLGANADSIKVTIRDATTGAVVRQMDLGSQAVGTVPVIWDGTNDAGTKAADGQYTFTVAATSAGTAVDATALSFGTVASVSTGTDGVKLNVSNIGSIKPTDVIQIL
jgi:flagellar basal-body rod modification protein FlgD